jgi:predicted 3-demethylubiquinone-9 3-methyltransferase (glyoxalase superfamily)
MSKITPCLWFSRDAEEAARFYVGLLPDSRIDAVDRSPADYPGGKKGDVLTVSFTLAGQPYLGLNGGSPAQTSNAVSFMIDCADQQEVDRIWDALLQGGEPMACGWIRDRFGTVWQVVPTVLMRLMSDPDRAKAGRVMAAMMEMVKFDIAALEAAAAG